MVAFGVPGVGRFGGMSQAKRRFLSMISRGSSQARQLGVLRLADRLAPHRKNGETRRQGGGPFDLLCWAILLTNLNAERSFSELATVGFQKHVEVS